MMLRNLLLVLLVTVLCSCSESQTTSDQAANKQTKQPAEHMLSDQQRMMEKAKETEKLVQEADEKRRKALEDAGG